MKATDSLPALVDDGLETPEIGTWGENKYRLVLMYAEMFVKAMRKKWSSLVYIDLFAGAGRSRLKDSRKIVPSSPTLALGIANGFDRFIFCEKEKNKVEALKRRVSKAFGPADCTFLRGDANQMTSQILAAIPKARRGFTVLGLCFSDPYALSNLRFSTLGALSERFLDHLTLIPTGMDANRNLGIYLDPSNKTVDDYLGNTGWRPEWAKAERLRRDFDHFLTDSFAASMVALGYGYPGIAQTELIRSVPQNLPLYRLALFSRSELGTKFWSQARKYSKQQMDLFS